MPELAKDVVALLQYLVPGFVVAWVYFGLTSHTKPSQFERVIQALIFTVVVQVLVAGEQSLLEALGKHVSFGQWTASSTLLASLITAILVGIAMSVTVNADALHRMTRRLGITTRTGHPCEWFGIFSDYQRYVVLQLKDGTRVYGWPKVWPSEAERGHFFVTSASRSCGGEDQELDSLEGILIDVRDVSFVEFVKRPEIKYEQIQTASPTFAEASAGAPATGTSKCESAVKLRAPTRPTSAA